MQRAIMLFFLAGCASGAQTWPQVVDNHIVLSTGTVCWALLCVVWLIRGPIKVNIDARKGEP